MPNPQAEFKRIRHMAHEARELFVKDVKEASKKAMAIANDIKGAIGEVSITEAKETVLKEFEKELMK